MLVEKRERIPKMTKNYREVLIGRLIEDELKGMIWSRIGRYGNFR